jgi:hypothetical protein
MASIKCNMHVKFLERKNNNNMPLLLHFNLIDAIGMRKEQLAMARSNLNPDHGEAIETEQLLCKRVEQYYNQAFGAM